jgi:3-phosphoshikimate 1-carboxyvinyltransferase
MTCRALVLAALSPHCVTLHGALQSDDTELLAKAIVAVGASVQWSGNAIDVDATNGLRVDGACVDLGHGGTPARFMLALACLVGKSANGPARGTVVDGSAQLRSRPMGDMVELLRELGVRVDEQGECGRLPLCALWRMVNEPPCRGSHTVESVCFSIAPCGKPHAWRS